MSFVLRGLHLQLLMGMVIEQPGVIDLCWRIS